MAIKELTNFRQKYPQYKDLSDQDVADSLSKKYPDAYGKLSEKVRWASPELKGSLMTPESVKEKKPGLLEPSSFIKSRPSAIIGRATREGFESEVKKRQDILWGLKQQPDLESKLGLLSKKLPELGGPTMEVAKGVGWAWNQTFGRLFGAYRGMLAGKNPIEGLKNPDEQPAAIESVIKSKFAERMGADPVKNPVQYTWVSGMAGWALDLAGIHMIFNVGPKMLKAPIKAAKVKYTKQQGKAVADLKGVLNKELQAGGVNAKNASELSSEMIAQHWNKIGPLARRPGAIRKAATFFRSNKGKLGSFIKENIKNASAQASKSGYKPEVLKKLAHTGPKTTFGKLIEKQILAKEQVPLHPAEAGREALRGIVGEPVSSKFELTEPLDKDSKLTTIPKDTIQKAVETYASKQAGFDKGRGKTIGVTDLLRKQAGLKRWENMSAKEQRAEVETYLRRDIQKAGEEMEKGKELDYLLDRALDPLDPASGFYKGLLQHMGADITKEGGIKLPKPKPKKPLTPEQRQVQRLQKIKEAHNRFIKNKKALPPKPVSPKELEKNPKKANEVLKRPTDHSKELKANAKRKQKNPTHEGTYKTPKAYDDETTYWANYLTDEGQARIEPIKGSVLNDMQSRLNNGEMPKDLTGSNVIKINETTPIKGKKALMLLPDIDDILVDLYGKAEVRSSQFKRFAKKWGTPFMIGQKYPPFGKVYMGIQDRGIDYKAELFFEGAKLIEPANPRKLSEDSKAKVAERLREGNLIGRYYNNEELRTTFKLNDKEVKAYNAMKRLLAFDTDVEVKSRMRKAKFEEASPDEMKILEENIREQVSKRKGYVPEHRLGGDWIVYKPPEPGKTRAKFFNIYDKKSEALKVARDLDTKPFKRQDFANRQMYRHLTMVDLEHLIEASDVDTTNQTVKAMRDTLRRRTFSSHWMERKKVPGVEWDYDSIYARVFDYHEGAVNKLARIEGRRAAETAYRENQKDMSPELNVYTRDFIDDFYNSGAIGFRSLQRAAYMYKLAFKTSWLAQNLTQPLATTYPVMARYYKGLNIEKKFVTTYGMASRYIAHRFGKGKHGLSSELVYLLNKLHRQNVLGDQETRFQLGIKGTRKGEIDKHIGLFGRIGEGINRTHAAIAGHRIAEEIVGLKSKEAKLEFMKEFIYKTQFAYGRQNLPQVITGAGNVRNFIRTAYTFRSYSVNYLQLFNSMMPYRGAPARQTTRAIGALVAQSGIKGLPFFALLALGYKIMTGRTMDEDMREGLDKVGLSQRQIDVTLHGVHAGYGVDATNLVGAGDVISTYGSVAEQAGGALVGMGKQLGTAAAYAGKGIYNLYKDKDHLHERAVWEMQRGNFEKALEYASPDVLRNYLRASRWAKEGLKTRSGEVILANPSQKDIWLRGVGLTSMDVSRAYSRLGAERTLKAFTRAKQSEFNKAMAEAKNPKERIIIMERLKRYNESVEPAYKVKPPRLSDALYYRRKARGLNRPPRKLRRRFRKLEELYGEKGVRK